MRKYRIQKWEGIKGGFTHKLLLGNGASRAVWDGLKYPSLYQAADETGRIDNHLKELFSDFGTNDFELILRLLSQTNRINKKLHIKDDKTEFLYIKLRQTLIDTIRDKHPKHEQVKLSLIPMANFMSSFQDILSLNYDLLVYWAMLEWNEIHGNWFKDGFVDDGRFDNNYYEYLYKPRGADNTTMVFYPHGSLILATDFSGSEIKLSKSGENYLLDIILNIWETGYHVPLFVSEGGPTEKLEAIRRSNYLKTVYDTAVNDKTESLAIFGWSFRDEDEHILRGIIKGGVERIAVSVHTSSGNAESFCETVHHKLNMVYHELGKEKRKTVRKCPVYFFDSDSDGCWTKDNPNENQA